MSTELKATLSVKGQVSLPAEVRRRLGLSQGSVSPTMPWALDTHVLVRYITQDDKRQAAFASRFIEQELSSVRPGLISLVTLLETIWVLEGRYGLERVPLCDLLDDLLATASLEVDEAPAVRPAIALYRNPGVDFHDALIATLATARGAQAVTFDAKTSRRLGMRLLV